jgi:hypothetical protein
VRPLKEKPDPLGDTCVILTVDPPVLVRVSVLVLFVPTWTLPNAKLEGLGVSTPGVTPSPVKFSTTVLFFPKVVVANETLPLKLPAPVGAKVIVTEAELPAFRVNGVARLLIANPAPLSVA